MHGWIDLIEEIDGDVVVSVRYGLDGRCKIFFALFQGPDLVNWNSVALNPERIRHLRHPETHQEMSWYSIWTVTPATTEPVDGPSS